MQPGQTITPGSMPPEPSQDAPEQAPAPPEVPLAQLQPPSVDSTPTPEQEQPVVPEQSANWQFTPDDASVSGDSVPQQTSVNPVSWTASEFVSHEKNTGWYISVVVSAIILAVIIYFLTSDLVSPIVIVVVGIAFAAFGARKPRVLDYMIDSRGIHIGNHLYPYGMFRTFSVIEEGAIRSILLMPLQRFNLPINVYYDPADEEEIVKALGIHLPHQDRKPASIDNFMRKIRF